MLDIQQCNTELTTRWNKKHAENKRQNKATMTYTNTQQKRQCRRALRVSFVTLLSTTYMQSCYVHLSVSVSSPAANVTLNQASASPVLHISPDQKSVMLNSLQQNMPHYPDLSPARACVRGRGGFTSGKHWWAVRVAGEVWSLGLVRDSLYRSDLVPNLNCVPWLTGNCLGPSCPYPFVALPPFQTNIKVFLDYEKGLVFFDVNDHLFITAFTTRFSDTIYPVFCLGEGTHFVLSSAGENASWSSTIYTFNQ